ncbi:MAG: hypothetical protein ABI625_11770 [bacterium]
MRLVTSFGRCAAAVSLAVVVAAHVGSPDVYFAGMAGPYAIDVAIRPPKVVPGIAQVNVHVRDSSVSRVVVRPVFWRAGTKGAPTGDDAKPIPGRPGSFTGELWLMATGSYSVNVTVSGRAGTGTAVVPVVSVATGQLALSPLLRWLLGILGTLLVAGVITAIHAAAGEAQVDAGEAVPAERKRKARIATIIAVPVLAFVVFGGANWWNDEAMRYTRTLYRPVQTKTTIADVEGVPTLTISVLDTGWRQGRVAPLMPDHGKLAHLFIARADSPYVFAHLHPDMPDQSTLVAALPPLPFGKYRVYTDVVHETGFQRTLTDSFTLKTSLDKRGLIKLSADDAWSADVASRVERSMPLSRHGDSLFIGWKGNIHPGVNETNVLQFSLWERDGKPAIVEPYLGMYGHAVVIKDDGSVFIHLHPSGTSAMASQEAFAIRDRGDTTREGRLKLDAAPMSGMATPTHMSEISFPYAFPSAGRYRVWVQVRVAGVVHTSGYDVTVVP